MLLKKKITSCISLFLIISIITGCNATGGDNKNNFVTNGIANAAEVTEKEITDSYVYLLGRALAVRQELMDFKQPGLAYNKIKYNEAGKADFVNPNLDVAYMEAWFALDEQSGILLEVPKIDKRYYTVQLMDGWGEVLYNINERNFSDHPYGKYFLCLDGSSAATPPEALRVTVRNKKIKMLARVELQNTLKEAIALQHQFKATTVGNPKIEHTPPLPDFSNKELPDITIFEFADQLLATPDSRMPGKDSIQAKCKKVAAFSALSDDNKNLVIKTIREKTIPQFLNYAINKAGKLENNWLATLIAGEYKGNYWTRTAANFVGIWANSPDEVIYFIASRDDRDSVLKGGQTYVLHFPKDKLPQPNVNAFWSIILVDFPNYRVVDNDLKRYNFNNFSKFHFEKDGSLKIYIASSYNGKYPKSNWLPSVETNKAFNLTLRMYVPKENVIRGLWFPSPVTKSE